MSSSEKFTLAALPEDASAESREMQPVLQQLMQEAGSTFNWHSAVTELPTYQAARAQDAAYRGRLALAAVVALRANAGRLRTTLLRLLEGLMRTTISLGDAGFIALFQHYGLTFDASRPNSIRDATGAFPVGLTLGQVEKSVKKNGLSEPLAAYLTRFLAATAPEVGGFQASELIATQRRLQAILNLGNAQGRPTLLFAEGDAFGQQLTQFAAGLPDTAPTTRPWLHLLQLWQKASGGQPTAKFRKELDAATAAVGAAAVREQGRALLTFLLAIRPAETSYTTEHQGYFTSAQLASMYGPAATITPQGYSVTRTETRYLLEPSQTVAKGLIWTLIPLADDPILAQLASYATYCYHKVPGKGPLALALGNACLLALSHGGLPGVAALARVRLKIKQTNTQALIAGYIEKASQELGVSPDELEDMAVPDFDLRDGRAEWLFGDYTATLLLENGQADVRWAKAGKPLKAAPAALKSTHAAELKGLKNSQLQAQQTYTAQRERLDRSFVAGRRLAAPWFGQYYAGHGLLGLLTRQLIWRFHHPDGTHTDALWLANAWRDARHQPVAPPTHDDAAELWHPVLATPAEVLAWRALLEAQQVQQPIKQAFREVYLLTPPEERTRTYSNRMAAHILKQHQFNSLAKLRSWKYRLLGAYDKGYETETATLALPAHNLLAEFWVSEVDADHAFNDAGIWLYVSTDQVRFTRAGAAVPLPEVPALAFSEVLRDVDLFVGVASVGNDPQWRDNGGLTQFRTYWENYSFGELGEVAKNRKLALQRLVPRLKIGKVSTLTDRFLVVQGKLRTYKIHLGSGNILMEPNDQYLCIVPDRAAKNAGTADVFLPFEGDAVLSIILSKALLLLDDDKITDDTIKRQIQRP